MRTTFIKTLVEEARKNERVYLLVGDLGYHVVEPFADEFPDRFLNVGISEQNMAGMASGLAQSGYNVYIYSIGNFPTLRCLEQIRNDIAYNNANVKIVAVGAGFAYGSQGFTHHATEDLGIMRTIPNIVVCSPCDPFETRVITSMSAEYSGTMYIRIGKAGEAKIFSDDNPDFHLGDIHTYKENGCRNAIFATGSIMKNAIDFMEGSEMDADVYSFPFVSQFNKEQLAHIVDSHHEITVIEEHQKNCGLGSAVCETLNDLYYNGRITAYPRVKRIGIDGKFFSVSGDQDYLRNIAHLTINKDSFQ